MDYNPLRSLGESECNATWGIPYKSYDLHVPLYFEQFKPVVTTFQMETIQKTSLNIFKSSKIEFETTEEITDVSILTTEEEHEFVADYSYAGQGS
jgi:hypothetical protein